MSYMDDLRDPRWQKKRLEALQAGGWKCRKCGSADKTLNVHHKRYRRGAKPWEYDLGDLEVRCEDCHKSIHRLREELDKILTSCDCQEQLLSEVLGYCTARIALAEGLGRMVPCDGEDRAYGIAAVVSAISREGSSVILAKVRNGFVDVQDLEREECQRWLKEHQSDDNGSNGST